MPKDKLSISEQVRRIQGVFNKSVKYPSSRFQMGKYTGRSLEWVVTNDREYCLWVLTQDFIAQKFRNELEYSIALAARGRVQ